MPGTLVDPTPPRTPCPTLATFSWTQDNLKRKKLRQEAGQKSRINKEDKKKSMKSRKRKQEGPSHPSNLTSGSKMRAEGAWSFGPDAKTGDSRDGPGPGPDHESVTATIAERDTEY